MFEEEITRGAQVLDQHVPAGWRDRVDLDVLDMWHVERCVTGQLLNVTGSGIYGGDRPWAVALSDLGAPPPGPRNYTSPAQVEWTYEHGFNARPDANGVQHYATLTAEWRAYILGTRSTATPPDEENQT